MGISLTLTELKEYFKIWHENNFNELHKQKITEYIGQYLDSNGLSDKINITDDIKTTLTNIGKVVSQMIDGESNLSNSSSLTDVTNELINKIQNNSLSSVNLKQLSTKVDTHTTTITNLSQNKIDKEYVDNAIASVEGRIGTTPTQIQTQNIPIDTTDASKDLNNYKTPGLFRSINAQNTSTLQNVPAGAANSGFNLIVLLHLENSVKQLLLTGENTASGNRIYMRNYLHSAGQWSEWYELYGEHNLQPLQMKVEWSEGGETTYTLLQR